jgi:hypothetical protein
VSATGDSPAGDGEIRPDRVEPPRRYECRCVIVTVDGSRVLCETVAVPDSPFCVSCLDRHPDLDERVATVRAE